MSDENVNDDELKHYGILRRSGRYPWGSGENPYQRGISFKQAYDVLKKEGMTQTEIAKAFGMNTSELRATISISKNTIYNTEQNRIFKMKERGMSNAAIALRMGMPESTIRHRLKDLEKQRVDLTTETADVLQRELERTGNYIQVGEGVELQLGISPERLKTVTAVLKDRGYETVDIFIEQATNPGFNTTIKVLAPKGTTRGDVLQNLENVSTFGVYSNDYGHSFEDIKKPVPVNPDRVSVVFAEDGGDKKDGVIELRRGVDDLGLGGAQYAQVRIQVGDDHFLKGMAVYSDDLPKGVDIRFNTNAKKESSPTKFDAMKPLESDETNPFKSTVRQKHYKDSKGILQQSPLNIVGSEDPDGKKFAGEEGSWAKWSRNLSSQMLSKQTPTLAKQQLDLALNIQKEKLSEIMSLTNPTVRKELLASFSDSVDAAANKMKAAPLPGTANHVILPVNSLKDNEIYAPNYRNGERVVLIRHPHGGIFEIPELTVNNNNKEAKSFMNQAIDAVGINSNVAQRLSGADFDGDTVLVIPTDGKMIKTEPALKGLKNFDPMTYQDKSLPKMTNSTLQQEMGNISNLITDMTVKGAPFDEISKAVRHSMVVIDSKKHKLDYKQSKIDNDVSYLKKKYQGSAQSGASTIISRSDSEIRIPKRRAARKEEGGPIDPNTGKKMFVETGETYFDKKSGGMVPSITKVSRMSTVDDAMDLVSNNPKKIELVYSDYANGLKALANQARKEMINTPNLVSSKTAKQTYAEEVKSLTAKLNIALKNKPLERQAQLVSHIVSNQKKAANPELDKADMKKIKAKELQTARDRLGARRQKIEITPKEWEAIQSGAISDYRLRRILQNTDLDVIKQYAMPKAKQVMGAAMIARAKAMMSNGYTQAEIASALGVSTSTINNALNG